VKKALVALVTVVIVISAWAATAAGSTGWLTPTTKWYAQEDGPDACPTTVLMCDTDLFFAQDGTHSLAGVGVIPAGENSGVIARYHGRGQKVVCYLDTGAWESYRPDAKLFPSSVIGRSTGWSGEKWLDIRPASWPKFAQLIWNRLDLAVQSGCDGIEPDQNNPVGNRPGFPITYADENAWYLEVARQAHNRGLTVLMKNGIELLEDSRYASGLVSAFDGQLNEECFQYKECDDASPLGLHAFVAAGKWVGEVEYKGQVGTLCPYLQSRGFMAMKAPLGLDGGSTPCW